MQKNGVLYGVGVGPGDPELLTLKALRLLREADVVAAPDTGGESHTALSIVAKHIQGKPILYCSAPMTRDPERLERAWQESADAICTRLEEGKTVVFITLGDPTIYSTYLYIHRKVLSRGFRGELVPGVPSFCAAAAKLNVSLCEGEERLLIVPASHGGLEESLSVPANKVLMKSGRQLKELKETLAQRGELENASLVVNCGLPGERIEPELSQADPETGYFSIVLVKSR